MLAVVISFISQVYNEFANHIETAQKSSEAVSHKGQPNKA